jgi:acyl carrier protein
MTDQEIFDKILEIAKQAMPELDTEQVTPQTVINRDLGADSLSFIMIICKMEGAFGIEIPDNTWERLSTMQDLIDTVKQLQKKAARS